MITGNTYSRYTITDHNSIPFSADEYSRFKYGCKDIARKFGHQLAAGFIEHALPIIPPNLQIVVIPSPYNFIPTATFAMKDYFVQALNAELVRRDMKVIQETKIHRGFSYPDDYGSLDADSRDALMKNDHFHIDTEFVKGKYIIFLDDIKITGSHERRIIKMAQEQRLSNACHFVYFAELDNASIHPRIENYLNYYSVKSLLDLDKIIKNQNFLLNTRMVKYILAAQPGEFNTFILYQSYKFISNLYHQAIGNSYHTIPEYKANINYLVSQIGHTPAIPDYELPY